MITVIGGLTSIAGAIYGTFAIKGFDYFQTFFSKTLHIPRIDLLVTGPGVILTLLFSPGGFAQVGYETRDKFLRWVADRRNLVVPSLFADRRVETGEDQQAVVAAAEHRVVEDEGFERAHEATIACPVCRRVLSVEEAPEHEHLRVGAGSGPRP